MIEIAKVQAPIMFRCSKLGDLMEEPRDKKAKEAGLLGETAKTYVDTIWLENNHGYKKIVYTPPMLKGLLNEQDSLGLVQKVLKGEFRIKNTERRNNGLIIGTADCVLQKEDVIEDVKSSWDIETFFHSGDKKSYVKSDINKIYYWQGQGYMKLFNKSHYRLIYCLTRTPQSLILEEKKTWFFKFGCDEENPHYKEICEQIDINHFIEHIPLKDRIKVFDFDFSPEDYAKIESQCYKGREYYKFLHL
jgi:hypothetical protein